MIRYWYWDREAPEEKRVIDIDNIFGFMLLALKSRILPSWDDFWRFLYKAQAAP